MSLLPPIDFELASLDGHRRTRNKLRSLGYQNLVAADESEEMQSGSVEYVC